MARPGSAWLVHIPPRATATLLGGELAVQRNGPTKSGRVPRAADGPCPASRWPVVDGHRRARATCVTRLCLRGVDHGQPSAMVRHGLLDVRVHAHLHGVMAIQARAWVIVSTITASAFLFDHLASRCTRPISGRRRTAELFPDQEPSHADTPGTLDVRTPGSARRASSITHPYRLAGTPGHWPPHARSEGQRDSRAFSEPRQVHFCQGLYRTFEEAVAKPLSGPTPRWRPRRRSGWHADEDGKQCATIRPGFHAPVGRVGESAVAAASRC
jgi:hypothetical protein